MGQENGDYDALEGRLCREFGPALRRLLIDHLSGPLREADRIFFHGEFRDLEHFLFRYFDGQSKEMDWKRGQAIETVARLFEQRQQFFNESPGLKATNEKVAAASPITFVVRLSGYSSIDLDLSVGSIKNVADVFDKDFDSFRIFLEAFVPQAYTRVFGSSDAHPLDCEVKIPNSFAQAFSAAATPTPPSSAAPPDLQPGEPSPTGAREKAEWLWRLANGSLLVPVALSLVVLYLGMSMLHDIGKSQHEMMAPIFEHQMRLLEEDRRRLVRETAPTVPPTPPKPASSK